MKELTFRKAHYEDLDQYFKWANDPNVRKNAVDSESIPYENHCEWFQKKLSDSNCYMYLFFYQGKPCGQIRFEIHEGVAEIDFSVDKSYRGKGLGIQILTEGTEQFKKEAGSKILIKGIVKKINTASLKAFHKSGFSEVSQFEKKGVLYSNFIKE